MMMSTMHPVKLLRPAPTRVLWWQGFGVRCTHSHRSSPARTIAAGDVTHDPEHPQHPHQHQHHGDGVEAREKEAAMHRVRQKVRFMKTDLHRLHPSSEGGGGATSPYRGDDRGNGGNGEGEEGDPSGLRSMGSASFQSEDLRGRIRHLPFSSIAASSLEMKAMMTMTCTEFDHTGELKSSGVKYLKSDLSALHGLETRDLRTLDSFRNQVPTILVRKSAIVVNLEHIKAIIKTDEFVLFDTVESDNYHQSLFVFDLQERLRVTTSSEHGSLPYELRAFEAILVSVTSVLRDQFQKLAPKVHTLLRRLETDSRVDRDTLLDVLDFSKKLNKLESRVTNVHQAITELLNSDSDMADMYLTARKETGTPRPAHLHQEVEFMLEFYTKQLEELESQATQLISNIRTTQDITQITLNTQRNALLVLEIRLVMATLGVTSGTLIAGLFGMNLKSGFESHPLAFYFASSTILVGSIGVIAWYLRKLKRLLHTQ